MEEGSVRLRPVDGYMLVRSSLVSEPPFCRLEIFLVARNSERHGTGRYCTGDGNHSFYTVAVSTLISYTCRSLVCS